MTELTSVDTRVSAAGFGPGANGVTPPSSPDRQGVFLTDVIVELGFADRQTIDDAVRTAGQSHTTAERYLLDNGAIGEAELALAIAERNGLDHVDLDRFEVDMGVAEMINRSAASRYCAVPIAIASDGALIVAVEDPLDSLGVSDIEVMTRSEVRRAIATGSSIRALIEQLPDEAPASPPSPLERTVPPEVEAAPEGEGSAPPPPAPDVAPPPPPPAPESPAPAPESPEPAPPAPAPESPEPAHPPEPPQPDPIPDGELGDLSAELRALRKTAHRADALAAAVGRRIEALEDVEERAQRLEGELLAARERNADLERRLSGVDRAAAELRETTKKLEAMYRVLEESAG